MRFLFDRIDGSSWSTLGSPAGGPPVPIEGVYQGHEVFLRVLAHATEDEDPGLNPDLSEDE